MIKEQDIEKVCPAENEHLRNGTNERRQHQRFTVENMGVDCDMSSTSKVKIMNISSTGVLVMADKLINIGKSYALKIGYKDKQLFVKADAVWALLADSVKEVNGDVIPIYIAGMQFVNVIKGEISEIIGLLEATMRGNMHDAFMGNLQGNSINQIIPRT